MRSALLKGLAARAAILAVVCLSGHGSQLVAHSPDGVNLLPDGISAIDDLTRHITWYEPACPAGWAGIFWFYPSLGKCDDGNRILHLNACVRGSQWASVETVKFLIDGLSEEVHLPADRGGPGDVVPEYAAVMHVDLGEHGPLVQKIAGAREVSVSFDSRTGRKSYLLPAENLEVFRRVVSLFTVTKLSNDAVRQSDSRRKVYETAPAGPREGKKRGNGNGSENREVILEPNTPGMALPLLIESSRVEPTFPEEARNKEASATVILRIVIHSDGTVGNAEVVRGPNPDYGFNRAAIDAVKQWRYEPAKKDRHPVATYHTVIMAFGIEE